MAETFYGAWHVVVVAKDAAFSQRFLITGSDAADGAYLGTPGAGPGPVDGEEWAVTMEWNDDAGSGWRPSGVARTEATYTQAEGLVVTLGADDNEEPLRDGDFDDMIVQATSLDPRLAPLPTRPPEFTLPD